MKTRILFALLLLVVAPLMALQETTNAANKPANTPANPPASAPVSAPVTTPANTPTSTPAIIATNAPSGPVFVIPLHGEVSPAQFYFLRRALKEAQRANASAVVLDVDTFGGRVDSAMEEMDALLTTRIPTIAYVNTKAISAGSLISLAAKRIYMHPNALIGASAVVGGEGEDLKETMKEKSTSMVVAKARGAAKANGHAEDVAEAFVRKESEVKRGEVSLDTKDTLLTLNATDAAKLYNGQPLLATGTTENLESLLKVAGLTGTMRRVEPSGFEAIAFWITTLAPLLLIGGIAGAYIEMKAPGFGIPGIISVICFALFFGGHFIAGLAGWEVIVVFVIGLALIISEVFIHPGTIIPGLVGVLLLLGSLVWAMVDYWPGAPSLPSREEFERPMANIIMALIGGSIAISLIAKYLPKIPLFNRLILSTASAEGPSVSIPMANLTVKTGDIGTATTTLRPAGKAIFGREVHDVVTNGDFIDAGTKVRVASTDGMRVVVDAA
jgi:membrane-bound serine protease (ClpP class)